MYQMAKNSMTGLVEFYLLLSGGFEFSYNRVLSRTEFCIKWQRIL